MLFQFWKQELIAKGKVWGVRVLGIPKTQSRCAPYALEGFHAGVWGDESCFGAADLVDLLQFPYKTFLENFAVTVYLLVQVFAALDPYY
jgi:hypothetical protein